MILRTGRLHFILGKLKKEQKMTWWIDPLTCWKGKCTTSADADNKYYVESLVEHWNLIPNDDKMEFLLGCDKFDHSLLVHLMSGGQLSSIHFITVYNGVREFNEDY